MEIIKSITEKERNLNGWDFFLLWAGAAVSLAEIWAGGLLVPLGFISGVIVIILGHIIGNTPMALGGIMGTKTGLPTMATLRPSFGIRGSYFPALLNVIQLIGWTAIMLLICGQAADSISKSYGFSSQGLWILTAGIITTLWAVVGHRFWKWLHRIAVSALLILCIFMSYLIFTKYGLTKLLNIPPKGNLSFMLGLDLVIAMPISWLPLISDYSRYAKSGKSSFWGTYIGYFIISSWMYLLGLAASLATSSSDPTNIVINIMISFNWIMPALIIILFSTFATTFLDIYSTAMSALNIFPRLNEKLSIIIGGLLGTLLALIFPMEQYENFLLFIGSMFCPIFGIALADFFIKRKKSYEIDEFFKKKGKYWYKG